MTEWHDPDLPGIDRPLFYGRDGKPMTVAAYGASRSEQDVHVADTYIGEYWVSTVWLGTDHSFGSGPPLIFETMIFVRTEGDTRVGAEGFDGWMDRYATEAAALAGHDQACAMVRADLASRDRQGEA